MLQPHNHHFTEGYKLTNMENISNLVIRLQPQQIFTKCYFSTILTSCPGFGDQFEAKKYADIITQSGRKQLKTWLE